MINARNVTDEKIALLKKMNCVSVSIGFETGNERLRKDVLKRHETKEEIIQAVHKLHAAGIRTSSFNMLGIPFETRDTIMETIELNKKSGVQYPNTVFFHPYEGTELHDVSVKNGLFSDENVDPYCYSRPKLQFSDMSTEELIAIRERFLLYVKFPKEYYEYIERSEQSDAVGQGLTAVLYGIYETCVFSNDGCWNAKGRDSEYLARLAQITLSSDDAIIEKAEHNYA